MLFAATLGRDVDAALEFFGRRAHEKGDEPRNVGAVEAFLVLLVRTGRAAEALDAYRDLVPVGGELSRHAPSLLDLANLSGDWDRYAAICRERDDLLGFAAGLLARHGKI
jgi:hypothetical protein